MINKRLINLVPQAQKHIILSVFHQWLGMLCNVLIMSLVGIIISNLIHQRIDNQLISIYFIFIFLAVLIRFFSIKQSGKQSFQASVYVKRILREKVYTKLLKLGSGYTKKISTAELVQLSVEGVEQLESYFSSYLPQLLYVVVAPITLFVIVSFISLEVAIILFLCVPLIPIAIIFVQKFAKKLLSKYWGAYTELGDSFLENLQGITTLKIYMDDEYKHNQMNVQAEYFRKITMKVLSMQLNSIIVMDIIAYGGAGLGIAMGTWQYFQGNINFIGCFIIIMISADFFLPMRLLGSFFHIAMNGMASCEKIFNFLDIADHVVAKQTTSVTHGVVLENISYSYDNQRQVLSDVNLVFEKNQFVSIIGQSGCGKSTIAGIIMGIHRNYKGSITLSGKEVSQINEFDIMKNITLIGATGYLFKGTIKDNLLMGKPNATDQELWDVLDKVSLNLFIQENGGLSMDVQERGVNLSGGQGQRLSLARAILHDSQIYIFDEATSNIDNESENIMITLMHQLAKTKTIILISHRLANVVDSDNIYVMANGTLVGNGQHDELVVNNSVYMNLWDTQQQLEHYVGGNVK